MNEQCKCQNAATEAQPTAKPSRVIVV